MHDYIGRYEMILRVTSGRWAATKRSRTALPETGPRGRITSDPPRNDPNSTLLWQDVGTRLTSVRQTTHIRHWKNQATLCISRSISSPEIGRFGA